MRTLQLNPRDIVPLINCPFPARGIDAESLSRAYARFPQIRAVGGEAVDEGVGELGGDGVGRGAHPGVEGGGERGIGGVRVCGVFVEGGVEDCFEY